MILWTLALADRAARVVAAQPAAITDLADSVMRLGSPLI